MDINVIAGRHSKLHSKDKIKLRPENARCINCSPNIKIDRKNNNKKKRIKERIITGKLVGTQTFLQISQRRLVVSNSPSYF